MEVVLSLYRQADSLTGGSLSVLWRAVRSFNSSGAAQSAASLAYYAMFSLFPMLLLFIALGSYVLESDTAEQQVLGFIADVVPVSNDLIATNIDQVLALRGTVGVVGLVGLLWSASGFFTLLVRNINLAWPAAEARNFVKGRLAALSIVGVLVVFLALSLVASVLLDVWPRLGLSAGSQSALFQTPIWAIVSNLVSWSLKFALFFGLYRWAPSSEVKTSAALWAAAVAALAWEVATAGFSWYLSSGLARYKLVYGSLGTVVALMLWIYVTNLITLFGAHLSVALAERPRGN